MRSYVYAINTDDNIICKTDNIALIRKHICRLDQHTEMPILEIYEDDKCVEEYKGHHVLTAIANEINKNNKSNTPVSKIKAISCTKYTEKRGNNCYIQCGSNTDLPKILMDHADIIKYCPVCANKLIEIGYSKM